jgi:hypothetical protein
MLRELGMTVEGPIKLYSDAAAAKSFASRRGTGKIRHLETRHLWLQDQVCRREVVLERVAGEDNPADLLTKYLGLKNILRHLERMSVARIGRNLGEVAAEGGCQPQQAVLGISRNVSQLIC